MHYVWLILLPHIYDALASAEKGVCGWAAIGLAKWALEKWRKARLGAGRPDLASLPKSALQHGGDELLLGAGKPGKALSKSGNMRRWTRLARGRGAVAKKRVKAHPKVSSGFGDKLGARVLRCTLIVEDGVAGGAQLSGQGGLAKAALGAQSSQALTELGCGLGGGTTSGHGAIIRVDLEIDGWCLHK